MLLEIAECNNVKYTEFLRNAYSIIFVAAFHANKAEKFDIQGPLL